MLIATPKFGHGFTLIELLVGVLIIGILMSVAAPSYQSWIKNIQIRNAAESIANGLQRARAEAVLHNTNVAFTFTGADSSWSVSVVNPVSAVESWSATEGSQHVTTLVAPAGATMATFNNMGLVAANSDGSPPISQVDLAQTGGNRNMRIMIQLGGNAKMCDPNVPPTSTQACN